MVTERVFTHLLVPSDGADAAAAAARLAVRTARAFAASLDLLYVVDRRLAEELARFDARPVAAVAAELRLQGGHALEALAEEAARAGVVVTCSVREGDPFEEIVAHAEARGVDLIVMGHLGRRPRARVLLGSVAERVLEFAPCPVLVVKSG